MRRILICRMIRHAETRLAEIGILIRIEFRYVNVIKYLNKTNSACRKLWRIEFRCVESFGKMSFGISTLIHH